MEFISKGLIEFVIHVYQNIQANYTPLKTNSMDTKAIPVFFIEYWPCYLSESNDIEWYFNEF